MKLRLVIFSLLCIGFLKVNFAQDPHFSQIQYNPVYLNPANAGFANKDNRIVGNYRDQWRTIPIPFSTTFGSYDRKLKEWDNGWRIGGGVSFLYDRAGDGLLSTFNPNLTLALGKYFNDKKQLLNLGITSGITIKSLNYSKLTFDNQYIVGSGYTPGSPSGESFSNNNASFPNFTLGLNFSTKIGKKSNLDLGGAVSNLHQPKQNFLYFSESKLPPRYTAYAKALIGLGKKDKWNLQPAVIYNFQNKANNILTSLIAETRFKENSKGKTMGLGFGAGFRAQDKDAAIAYISVLYDNLRIGASYDINVSNFKKASNTMGAFELLLSYEWGNSEKKKAKCDTIKIKEYELQIDTVYLKQIDTVFIKEIDTIEIEKPSIDKVSEWNNRLEKLLPVNVYFDNDQPNPKTTQATTTVNYKTLYDNYINAKPNFAKRIGEQQANELFNIITSEFKKFDEIYSSLKEILNDGRTATLQFSGYTSPLASSSYNLQLSKRRIESVKNYFLSLENGYLKSFIDKGQLTFELLPLGKTKAPNSISDNSNDTKKSIYGKDASMERRVEIKYINIK